MKRLTFLCLLMGVCLNAHAYQRAAGYCEDGNYSVSVPGGSAASVNKFQRSFPSCTVTVYAAGTTNLSTIYADSSGTAKANPFTAASSGQWFFYAAGANYDVRFSGGGIVTPFTRGDVAIIDTTGAQTFSQINRTIAVDGIKYPFTTAGIQSAITDACAIGSTAVFIPSVSGGITLSGVGAELFLIPGTCSLRIHGPQMNAKLYIACSVGTTTDIFHIKPTILAVGFEIDHLDIQPAAGCGTPPGRYPFFIDASLEGSFGYNSSIHDVTTGPLGSATPAAIRASGAVSDQGTLSVSAIYNNQLCNGIRLDDLGDTVTIRGNRIADYYCGSLIRTIGIDVPTILPGASTLLIYDNNITSSLQCIHIGNGTTTQVTSVKIQNNECEDNATSTGGVNAALIDLDGGTNSSGNVISGNSVQIGSNSAIRGIRVNNAAGTALFANNMVTPQVEPAFLITANAVLTYLGINNMPSGVELVDYLGNSSATTYGYIPPFVSPGLLRTFGQGITIPNTQSFGSFDNTGTYRSMLSTAADGSVTLLGYQGKLTLEGVLGATYISDADGNTAANRAIKIVKDAPGSHTVTILSGATQVGWPFYVVNSAGADLFHINPDGSATSQGVFTSTGGYTETGAALAALGGAPNGTIRYCNNCKNVTDAAYAAGNCSSVAPATGALARKENGAWHC